MNNTTTIARAWNPWNPIDPKNGKPATSEAAKRRAQAEDRKRAIAALGWAPEPVQCPPSERYAAGTGELWGYVREAGITVTD